MQIKKLNWDSDFFGFNIADLEISATDSDLSEVDNFVKKNNIRLIQSCCDVADINSIFLLEKSGFHFVDLRVEFIFFMRGLNFDKTEFLLADKNDIPILKEIARTIFTQSRYNHRRFDKERVADFYVTWLEKSIYGWFDDLCLKIEIDNLPIGFLTLKLVDGIAKIGLMGINKDYQGKGLGTRLISSLFSFLENKDIEAVKVVTQGRNIAGQNFYIKKGFKIDCLKSWYYKFIDD